MGKQTGLIPFTGKLGGLIGYKVGDQHYVRSAAEQVHQSPATRRSSLAFGRASRLGAAMRHALRALPDGLTDSGSVNRLNKALLAVLQADDLHRTKRFVPQHFKGLKGFGCNPHAGLSKVLTVTPVTSRNAMGNITVTIPAMTAFTAHPRATHLCIKAVAVHVAPTYDRASATASDSVLINISMPAPETTLTVPAGKGAVSCVLLEVTSCEEEGGRMYPLRNRLYNAVEIVAVLSGKMRRRLKKRGQRRFGSPLAGIPVLPVDFFQRE